jgi:pimeloyl-ACP methyl ester carboxylesterase
MNSSSKITLILFFLLIFSLLSCSENSSSLPEEMTEFIESGSGVFNFRYQNTTSTSTLKIYYHLPENIAQDARILVVFHGAGRNARDYRDALISEANQSQFIVIAPEFSTDNFPGGDGYNLGNVFIDGDNPSITNINDESDWAFSVIEPLFDTIVSQIDNSSSTYDIFGHSAGGQFAHRFLMYKPLARANRIVASASGWYTFPDLSISFPYGFDDSPLHNSSLSVLFSHQLHIQVGANDNNPNASGLRRNAQADVQGIHRAERAENFFNFSQNLAIISNLPFQWSFTNIPNADHDFRGAALSAAQYLYN